MLPASKLLFNDQPLPSPAHVPFENRIGHFEIDCALVKQWRELADLPLEIFVVASRENPSKKVIEYVAYSKHFLPVAEGIVIPTYNLTVMTANKSDGSFARIPIWTLQKP